MFKKLGIWLFLGLTACAEPAVEVVPAGPSFPITDEYLSGHPSDIFAQAANFVNQGDLEQATLWFYGGQLRYRVFLDCPALNASPQDLIVFTAQFEIMEPKINGWASENLNRFVEILDRILAWDERNLDKPANYAACIDARAKVRATYENIRRLALSQ